MDYELGAELHNTCRRKGVQGSSTDFLICAMSVQLAMHQYSPPMTISRTLGDTPV